jgi:2-C-methyl-D-erythritol 4-phosphate cytidylyltransferase
LILAAGRGERLGAEMPKALVELAGRPLYQWSLEVLQQVAAIERIVLALPPDAPVPPGVTAVPGGAVRSASVRRALAAAGDGDPVLVHDAARPLLTAELAQRVIDALMQTDGVDGALAAAPVTDTIKQADARGLVTRTLERSSLWAVQTPQVFRRAALEAALDVPDEVLAAATDDASLVERAGGRIIVVPCTPENIKVTTRWDLRLAELALAERRDERP